MVQNLGPLISKRTNLAGVSHQIKKVRNKIRIEKKQLVALSALNEDNKNISDLTISKKEIEISDLENQLNILNNTLDQLLKSSMS